MRILALLLLAMLALPAGAQLQKCIDERGRVHYTDKPIPGCKPTSQQPMQPPAPAAKKDAAKPVAKAPVKAKPKAAAEPPPSMAECKAAKEQREWLLGERGRDVDMRETRIAQVERVMRKCGPI